MINNSSEIDNENEMKNNDIIPVTRYECEEVFTYCDCLLTYVVCWDFFLRIRQDEANQTKPLLCCGSRRKCALKMLH